MFPNEEVHTYLTSLYMNLFAVLGSFGCASTLVRNVLAWLDEATH